MSIATDKARIEGAKAALANWLTDKGVQLQNDERIDDLVSYLDNLPPEEGPLTYATSISFENNRNLPSSIELVMPACTSLSFAFKGVAGVEEIEITAGSIAAMNEAFSQEVTGGVRNSIKRITLNCSTAACEKYYSAFRANTALQEIDGVIDFTAASTSSDPYPFNYMFTDCTQLEEVRFAPNTLAANPPTSAFSSLTALSSDSLVSLANSLVQGSYTLKPGNNGLATLLSGVHGSVSHVGEAGAGYDLFVEDANGTLTLTDFITQVKGWTIS